LPAILTSKGIKDLIKSLPEASAWKDQADVFDRSGGAPHPDRQLPIIAYQPTGGKSTDAVAAAAAIACLQISIMVSDDMLDEVPRGEHERRGPSAAANLALAFQPAAFKQFDQAPVSHPRRETAVNSLTRATLVTAFGQHLDDQCLPRRVNCRAEVAAKSAQGVRINNGAVRSAAYHLVQRYQKASRLLEQLSLPVPDPIAQILSDYGKTLSELLSLGRVDIDLTNLRTEPVLGSASESE
jgi:hypothetical protein